MDSLVLAVLSNAALVSVLLPLAMVVDRLVRSPTIRHGLWLVLLLKLVTPPLVSLPDPRRAAEQPAGPNEPSLLARSDPSSRPGQPLVPVPAVGPEGTPLNYIEQTGSDTRYNMIVAGDVAVEPAPANPFPAIDWVTAAAWFWVLGATAWLILATRDIRRIRYLLAGSPNAPPEVVERVAALTRRIGLRRPPAIRMVPGVMPPAIWGVFRTRLLLPRDLWVRLDPVQRNALLLHELAHLRRRDHWVRAAEVVAMSIYWWFPVAWLIRRSLREAEEQCCDSRVVRWLPDARHAYARTLLETLDFVAEAPHPALVLGSGFDTVASLHRRLTGIAVGTAWNPLSRLVVLGLLPVALIVLPAAPPQRAMGRRWVVQPATQGDQFHHVHSSAADLAETARAQEESAGLAAPTTLRLHAEYDLALAPDGRVVIAGVLGGRDETLVDRVVVSRLNADGTPDRSFGAGGTVLTALRLGHSQGIGREAHVAVQADGRVLIAAGAENPENRGGSPSCDFGVARLNGDGSADPSFGISGYAFLNIGVANGQPERESVDAVAGIVVQPDGKIVVAGSASSLQPADRRFAVARLQPDGRPDPSFGQGGRIRIEDAPGLAPLRKGDPGSLFHAQLDQAVAVRVARTGQIVVAGNLVRNSDRDVSLGWKVARLDDRGRPDPDFGTNGVLELEANEDPRFGWSSLRDIDLGPDGSLTLVGEGEPDGPPLCLVLATIDRQGRLLSRDGREIRECPLVQLKLIHDIHIKADGGILVAGIGVTEEPAALVSDGKIAYPKSGPLVISSFTPQGQADRSFGDRGVFLARPVGQAQGLSRIQFGRDGRIVAVGFAAIAGRGVMPVVVQLRDEARAGPLLALTGLGTVLGAGALGLARIGSTRERRSVNQSDV